MSTFIGDKLETKVVVQHWWLCYPWLLQGVRGQVREKLKEQRRPLHSWLPPVLVLVKELRQPTGAWPCVTPLPGPSMCRFSCYRWGRHHQTACYTTTVYSSKQNCIRTRHQNCFFDCGEEAFSERGGFDKCLLKDMLMYLNAGRPRQWRRPGLPAELSALQLPLPAHCRPARQHFTGDS